MDASDPPNQLQSRWEHGNSPAAKFVFFPPAYAVNRCVCLNYTSSYVARALAIYARYYFVARVDASVIGGDMCNFMITVFRFISRSVNAPKTFDGRNYCTSTVVSPPCISSGKLLGSDKPATSSQDKPARSLRWRKQSAKPCRVTDWHETKLLKASTHCRTISSQSILL